MTPETKRWARRLVVSAVLAIPLVATLLLGLQPTPMEEAREWAASLSPTDRTAAISRLADLSAARQRVLLSSMSPEQKSDFWRGRFRTLLSSHPNLSPAAKLVLEREIEISSPELFKGSPEHLKLAKQVGEDLKRVLEPTLLQQLAIVDRSRDPSAGGPLEWLRARLTVSASFLTCDCVVLGGGDEYCPSGKRCDPQEPCNIAVEGCTVYVGFPQFWEDVDCYGVCKIILPGGS